MKNIIDNQLFAHLARCDGVERLNAGEFLTCEILDNVFEGTEQPFKNIRCLTLLMESEAVPLLVAGVKSVLALTLTIEETRTNPLPHISSLVDLQELIIDYLEGGEWAGTDFLALKNLKDLRILRISSISDFITSPTLTDEEFISIFENMCKLRELVFEIQCVLSTAAITSLGNHCPELKSCEMLGSYDLHCWQEITGSLFPQLRFLEFSGLAIDEEQASP